MFSSNNRQTDELEYFGVSINEDFIRKYSRSDLPAMPAGDAIFVAMAKVDGLDLVTEDRKNYEHAKNYGVQVFYISEYLNKLGGEPHA